jgi:hypothetical protein
MLDALSKKMLDALTDVRSGVLRARICACESCELGVDEMSNFAPPLPDDVVRPMTLRLLS